MTETDKKAQANIKNRFITNAISVGLQYSAETGGKMMSKLKRTPPKELHDIFGIPLK